MISCKGHILSQQQHQQWRNKHTLWKMHNDFLFTWFLGYLMSFVLSFFFFCHSRSLHNTSPLKTCSSSLRHLNVCSTICINLQSKSDWVNWLSPHIESSLCQGVFILAITIHTVAVFWYKVSADAPEWSYVFLSCLNKHPTSHMFHCMGTAPEMIVGTGASSHPVADRAREHLIHGFCL